MGGKPGKAELVSLASHMQSFKYKTTVKLLVWLSTKENHGALKKQIFDESNTYMSSFENNVCCFSLQYNVNLNLILEFFCLFGFNTFVFFKL